jgi:hypothetical protein
MTPSKPLIDPKELAPAAAGLVLGFVLIGAFLALSLALGLTVLVDHSTIPYQ